MNAEEVETWREADRLFSAWLDQLPLEREAWLAAQSLVTKVRTALDQLIAQHQAGESGISSLAQAAALQATPVAATNVLAGRQIGHWQLLEEIGRGGMAVVYRARRSGVDYEQLAAVKLLSLAAFGAQGSARFEQEQRLLARLRHPHIAGLIDGGLADDGTPFLVMTLIEGQTLALYCAHHRLQWQACVRLLIKVCDAVAHAHRNLMVHRDLKPTNIMVTEQGEPVLLDFGIAKLLDDSQANTHQGWRAMTPGYAAPEQIDGGPITTATDVYALGIIARELCAPNSTLPQDLTNVISMALRPDAARRYPDARALSEDFQRLLEQRPVLATLDSRAYRLRAFLRRRRGLVAAISAIAAGLIVGLALALWQAERASQQTQLALRQAARAEAARDFLFSIIASGDRERSEAIDPPVSTVIARGIATLQDAPLADPELHAEMAMLLGHIDTSIGQHQRAGELLNSALDSAQRAQDPALVTAVWIRQGILLNATGKPEAALAKFNAALDQAVTSPEDRRVTLLISSIGGWTYAMSNLGRKAQAAARLQTILSDSELKLSVKQRTDLLMMQATVTDDLPARLALLTSAQQQMADSIQSPADRLVLLSELSSIANALGRHAEALLHARAAAALVDRVHPGNTTRRARSYNNLGTVLSNGGLMAEADAAYATAEAIYRVLGDQHSPAFAALIHNRGTLLRDLGNAEQAVPLLADAARMATQQFGPADRRSNVAWRNLAMASAESGAHESAAEQWQQASQHQDAKSTPQDRYLLLLVGAHIATLAGDWPLAAERIAAADKLAAKQSVALQARHASIVASILSMQSKTSAASALFEQSAALCEEGGAETWSAAWRNQLAHAEHLDGSGEHQLAQRHYQNALALLNERGPKIDSPLRQRLRARTSTGHN